jgi:hypothetical protein
MAASKRLLIVSPNQVDGEALRDEVNRRTGDAPTEVRLIIPAVEESKLKHTFGDVDEAVAESQEQLAPSVEGLEGGNIKVSAAVGDADPLIATEDALGGFPADEVLIVTHRERDAEWFEEGLFERAAERFEPPVIHVELAGNGERLKETGESDAGVSRDEPDEGELVLSRNLPPFSKRDLLGIVVAIGGTIVLALLAASSDHGDSGFAGSSAVRILIAIAFALVNLAHVVGLLFFNSQKYRGGGRALFANLSLWGTLAALVVSLLL